MSRVMLVQPAVSRDSYSSHISGRRDVADEVPGNLDRGLFGGRAVHRARVAYRGVLLSVVVSDLA
jgi:hypothetical protein